MRQGTSHAWVPSLLILCSFVPAHAGIIYGSLLEKGKPAAGVSLEVACAGRAHADRTENDGSYRLFVRERGRCAFTVHYQGQSPSAVIYSYEDPVGYNFEIQEENGVYTLVKR